MPRNADKLAKKQMAADLAVYEALKELRDAAQRDDADSILMLLSDPEIDVNDPGQIGQTALHIAAANNSINAINALLEHGAAIDPTDVNKDTPLSVAVFGGKHDAAALLLESGAQTRINDHNGMGPIHIAVKRDDAKMLRILLAAGADPDHRTISTSGHQNADELAVYYNLDNMAAILKEHRAMQHAKRVKSLHRRTARGLRI